MATPIETIDECVHLVATFAGIEVPAIVDAKSGHAAADAMSFEAQYSQPVRLAASAARRVGWGAAYYREGEALAKEAVASLPGPR